MSRVRAPSPALCVVARVAQLVERILGKDEVSGSIPLASSGTTNHEDCVPREKIILECTECRDRNYFGDKNRRKHPERVEWKKYCPRCNKHQLHKESK